jgi:hypothetical protein
MSTVIRVPDHVHLESKSIAAVRGQQQGELLAEAWREYLASHREEFAENLQTAADLLRDGTLEELAAFASRNAGERARAAGQRARGEA